MPGAELIDVRLDVREIAVDDLYVDLSDDDYAAVEAGAALIVRVEATVVPANPGVPLIEAGSLDYFLPTPISWADVDATIDEALASFAEFVSARQFSVSRDDLKAVLSRTVHGDLPQPPRDQQ